MARVNVGIDPFFLSDQHLIAESVEITMITGGLKKQNFQIKSAIPKNFTLGTGHINFFKNKLLYLKHRLIAVNEELTARKIKNSTRIDLHEFPKELWNSWSVTVEANQLIKQRVIERLLQPKKASATFHRWYKFPIMNMQSFTQQLKDSVQFRV